MNLAALMQVATPGTTPLGATPPVSPTTIVGRFGSAPATTSATNPALPHLVLPHVEYHLLVPQLVLIASAVVLLGATSLSRRRWGRHVYAWWTAISGLGAAAWAAHLWGRISGHPAPAAGAAAAGGHAVAAVANAVAVDGFSLFFVMLVGVSLALAAMVSSPYLEREGLEGPEYYVLAMLSASGAMIMAGANDLIVLFLGLEILSISLYVLTGYHQRRISSGEAAMKYFVLGAFSSAFFLYGVALLYGSTGSTNLAAIGSFLASNDITSNGVLLAGMALLIVGLAFKVAAVPFHLWTPDVYQGAPTPVTGFMAAVAKAAGFAALLRVLLTALATQTANWQPIIWVLAALTLVVGSVLTVVQTNVKRMLAYSSISHAGFVLVGLVGAAQQLSAGATPAGQAGALFYLMAYSFMIIGTFAIVALVGGRGDGKHSLDDYRGLARERPVLAFAFAVLLMSQAGIPFTAGFFAKFYVIAALVGVRTTPAYVLAVIGMLSAVVTAFFYLRLILTTYQSDDAAADADAPSGATDDDVVAVRERLEIPAVVGGAIAISVAFTVVFGLVPAPLIHLATHANLLF